MQDIKNRIQKEAGGNSPITSFEKIYFGNHKSNIRKWFYGILIGLLILLFLPWTQNIRARGAVTTLRQEYRPQQLNTIIAGRIVKWHVKEGDMVKVKLVGVDPKTGKFKLSRKVLMPRPERDNKPQE